MTAELHIVSLASILALVYWLINAIPQLTKLSDNEKQALVFVAVFGGGILDNAVFYSGNAQLLNIVTTLYQLAIVAAGAVGTLKVAQKVSRGVRAFAAHRELLWQLQADEKRAQIKAFAAVPRRLNEYVVPGENG